MLRQLDMELPLASWDHEFSLREPDKVPFTPPIAPSQPRMHRTPEKRRTCPRPAHFVGAQHLMVLGALSFSLACQPSVADAELHGVVPNQVAPDVATAAQVVGKNLSASAHLSLDDDRPISVGEPWRAWVGGVPVLGDVQLVDDHTLSINVPPGLPLGFHLLLVRTPRGAEATLPDALEVRPLALARDAGSAVADAAEGSQRAAVELEVAARADANVADAASAPDAASDAAPANSSDAGADAATREASTSLPGVPGVVCASEPERLAGLSFSWSLFGPTLSSDALTLFYSEWTGGRAERILSATRSDRGSVFTDSNELSNLNDSGEGTPFLWGNDLRVFFYSRRGPNNSERDLYGATRSSTSSSFGRPFPLSDLNGPDLDHLPSLTPDGTTIVFTSNRDGSEDLWTARLLNPGDAGEPEFSAPQPIVELNTSGREAGTTFSPDGLTMYFASNRTGGAGFDDIWYAMRPDVGSPFGAPQPLTQVNAFAQERDPALSADGQELFFSSTRTGLAQLYRATLGCP